MLASTQRGSTDANADLDRSNDTDDNKLALNFLHVAVKKKMIANATSLDHFYDASHRCSQCYGLPDTPTPFDRRALAHTT